MVYVLSIDWLSVHCYYIPADDPGADDASDKPSNIVRQWEPVESDGGDLLGAYPWRYKLQPYATRSFSRLHFVAMPNEEGGWDDFAEVQSAPYSGILHKESVIVRFVNRALYRHDFWELAMRFLSDNDFVFQGISRIDICADFNNFESMSPRALIEGFAGKRFRHVGRGVGALYFNHGKGAERDEHNRPIADYGVRYTGLSFGTHASDARVYLYDKSFELLTQSDKPWIRDRWIAAGLDVLNVWRLEVSIKSKATKFKCRQTGETVTIDTDTASDANALVKIYLSFVAKMFAFVKNRRGITNITREPRLQLFDNSQFHYDRGVLRNLSAGNKMQRMIIKALYQLGDLYRGAANIESADLAQSFAVDIAESTDLAEWMSKKLKEWERPTHI